MNIKHMIMLLAIVTGTFFFIPNAGAYKLILNSVYNASWWEKDLSKSYLTIFDGNDTAQYSYVGNDLTDWSGYSDLVTDLSDAWIGDPGAGIEVGDYSIHSGGNVFSSYYGTIYKTLSLAAGDYTISLADGSGVYNLLGGSDEYWNAYVQIFGDLNDAFGDGAPLFSTEVDALNAYSDKNITFTLMEDSYLNFYINDWNSLDNIGDVTLNIQPASIPEPATLLLLSSGMFALAVKRRYRRKGR